MFIKPVSLRSEIPVPRFIDSKLHNSPTLRFPDCPIPRLPDCPIARLLCRERELTFLELTRKIGGAKGVARPVMKLAFPIKRSNGKAAPTRMCHPFGAFLAKRLAIEERLRIGGRLPAGSCREAVCLRMTGKQKLTQ